MKEAGLSPGFPVKRPLSSLVWESYFREPSCANGQGERGACERGVAAPLIGGQWRRDGRTGAAPHMCVPAKLHCRVRRQVAATKQRAAQD
ncbi:hypothetical protein MAPG_03375 [Magnaporthiopsis poae ATCC 64411]|uniref:Uncharacterized protein n=1 Tax=Magnaporthiopsis poae (strain ATCC 64411 / 73-15) TaxID=644358 RepID=A0A0C4DTU8_MAGP6|nr:hypothetical protein MAPG_03375 [Magnaporthiopsis poae ATCC 64411]